MQVLARTLDFGDNLTAEVIYAACWHYGNPSCDKDGIKKFLERAKTQPWWFAGDGIEGITPHDKRFAHSEHKDTILNQVAECAGSVSEASDTCWGYICGNHEWGASGTLGDVAEDISMRAGVPYLGACKYIEVKMPKGKALIFTAHGKGSMGFNSGFAKRDNTNRQLKLRRMLNGFRGENGYELVKCIAHFHRAIIAPAIDTMNATIENGEFKRRRCVEEEAWCMACPSMFKNYHDGPVSYAEMALYPPTDLGWLGIVFERDGTCACVREYDQDGIIVREVERELVR